MHADQVITARRLEDKSTILEVYFYRRQEARDHLSAVKKAAHKAAHAEWLSQCIIVKY